MDISKTERRKQNKNGHTNLLKAKKGLDDVLVFLAGAPALRDSVAAVREQVLEAYIAEERKLPEAKWRPRDAKRS